MSIVKPFKALFYSEKKISDFPQVVCPPYDVISPEEQDRLHALSPYNFTHIDFAKDEPGDTATDNKYSRAKKTYREWLQKGVLVQDDTPAIYFYKQEYKIVGQMRSRTGFISLMGLKDDSESKVYPHENTHAKAVDDRLTLTKTLSAQLSCIFVCYSDRQKKLDKLFARFVLPGKPLVDVTDDDRVHHRLWRVTDPAHIATVQEVMTDQQLFIADGHHRYKVSREYQDFRRAANPQHTGDELYNYVMTYFTNIDSPDLQIFPLHRIVRSLPENLDFLEEFFRVDKIKRKEDLLILLARAGSNEHAFGLYTRQGIKLLRLKNRLLIDKFIAEGSKEFKNLDASILKSFVFDRVGIDSKDITYTPDLGKATEMVDSCAAAAGFILNPVKIAQLKAIALNGERMPPKTTYFYPKVLSGLTAHSME